MEDLLCNKKHMEQIRQGIRDNKKRSHLFPWVFLSGPFSLCHVVGNMTSPHV